MPEMTEEQLANMSPEELKQMQKEQCIFCHIISGKVASRKIYEDDKCIAVLDINPANPGHVLVMPKEHHSIMQLMPEPRINHLFKVVKKISAAQIRALKADATNVFVANGAAAGQKAPHFMIHVIPRKQKDGIDAFDLIKNQIAPEDQEKLSNAITNRYHERYGAPPMVGGYVSAEPGKAPEEDEEKDPFHVPPPEHFESIPEEHDDEENEETIKEAVKRKLKEHVGRWGGKGEPKKEQAEEITHESGQEDKEYDLPDPDSGQLLPPEHFEGKHDDDTGKENKPKKKFDLDAVSKLFG